MGIRQRRETIRDAIVRRNPAINQIAAMKSGKARKRIYARKAGNTFTVSFTVSPELDQLIDFWSMQGNCSRSSVVRQALILADDRWRNTPNHPRTYPRTIPEPRS